MRLIKALMDRPYHTWKESTSVRFAVADLDEEDTRRRLASTPPEAIRNCKYTPEDHICSFPVTWGGEVIAASPNAYHGRIIFLVDGGCVSGRVAHPSDLVFRLRYSHGGCPVLAFLQGRERCCL